MEIGDNIIFIYKGKKEWQGNKEEIFSSENQHLQDFVFASNLYKKIKNANK
jgi:phospholipid/cholesterol/gamma-HCH transport system ATP-binding protein